MPLTSVAVEATYGEKYDLYVNAPKILKVTLTVPAGYSAPTTVKITNMNYGDAVPKVVDFCGGAVVSSGDNVPCIDPAEDPTLVITPDPDSAAVTEDG